MSDSVKWFSALGMDDLEEVGGKNASLGEMISNLASADVRVPDGFATTAHAFREFIAQSGLAGRINDLMHGLDSDDVDALARAGKAVRQAIVEQPLQPELEQQVREAFGQLTGDDDQTSFAVRSSATAEDLPDASFAGQQETFLNIRGIDAVLQAIHEVFASLYNDRAIAYRVHHGFEHADVALSAGVQRMVRSDIGASGVMFTMDTESGFTDAVFVTASYGLGESVVQGAVNPDEWYVWKPGLRAGRPASPQDGRPGRRRRTKMVYADGTVGAGASTVFTDVEASERAQVQHHGCRSRKSSLDSSASPSKTTTAGRWTSSGARTASTGQLYILQARPETVQSRRAESRNVMRALPCLRLEDADRLHDRRPDVRSGRRSAQAPVRVHDQPSRQMRSSSVTGEVLVADMTDPDWEPIMKLAIGHRHQSRWPDVSRGDHRAGTRHSGRRRHRRRPQP